MLGYEGLDLHRLSGWAQIGPVRESCTQPGRVELMLTWDMPWLLALRRGAH